MTRADWYARHHAGCWRIARAERRCEQSACFARINKGEQYFDTNQVTTWPKTKKICACCAREETK